MILTQFRVVEIYDKQSDSCQMTRQKEAPLSARSHELLKLLFLCYWKRRLDDESHVKCDRFRGWRREFGRFMAEFPVIGDNFRKFRGVGSLSQHLVRLKAETFVFGDKKF